ncbi:hypothetical protein QBC41DRAFT_315458 [Cercophora samala]|uniref:Uncharacterized protein n=1 Tax=Cercophora samala TaxID=330535 RepID=A0AA39ZI70_9PEZI|nr:hypothetical protein QBC41DRAFT_315458 [Cercophora samala]
MKFSTSFLLAMTVALTAAASSGNIGVSNVPLHRRGSVHPRSGASQVNALKLKRQPADAVPDVYNRYPESKPNLRMDDTVSDTSNVLGGSEEDFQFHAGGSGQHGRNEEEERKKKEEQETKTKYQGEGVRHEPLPPALRQGQGQPQERPPMQVQQFQQEQEQPRGGSFVDTAKQCFGKYCAIKKRDVVRRKFKA